MVRIAVLALVIAFGPALLGLIVTTMAFLLRFHSTANVVGPMTITWVHLCLPYLSGALPYGEFPAPLTLGRAVVVTIAQLILIAALVAPVLGSRRDLRWLFLSAVGSVAASSLVAHALLSAYDLASYLERF